MCSAAIDCVTNVRWPVSDLIKQTSSSYQFLTSNEFAVLGSDVSFRMEFELRDVFHSPDAFSLLYLSVRDFNDEESVKIRFKVWLETNKGNKLTSNQEIEEDISLANGNDRLYYDIGNSDLGFFFEHYPDSTVLFVCCEMRLADPVDRLNDSYSSAIEFRKNLWLAHTEGLRGYCTIEAEGEKFSVSKELLMSQSKVFERMFLSDSIEARDNAVVIKDVRADVIRATISYLYLGKPQNYEAVVSELFVFADKYEFEKLKGQCLQHLIQTMSEENIVVRLVYAFYYNNSVLKTRTLAYIKTKFASDKIGASKLVETVEWNMLEARDSELADEIKKEIFETLN